MKKTNQLKTIINQLKVENLKYLLFKNFKSFKSKYI